MANDIQKELEDTQQRLRDIQDQQQQQAESQMRDLDEEAAKKSGGI